MFVVGHGRTQVWEEETISGFRVALRAFDDAAKARFAAWRGEVAGALRREKALDSLASDVDALAKDQCRGEAAGEVQQRFEVKRSDVARRLQELAADSRGPAAAGVGVKCKDGIEL